MQRDRTIDVLKGLAIISIVQCHAAWVLPNGFPIGAFTYTFHVMSFVFVSGFLFSGISDEKKLYSHIGKKVVKLWSLFFAYSMAMHLLNSVLIKLHILGEDGGSSVLIGLCQAVMMVNEQQLLFPMWFVPMFLICSCLFAGLFYFAQKRKFSLIWHIGGAIVCAAAAMYCYKIGFHPQYYAHVSLLSIPVMYAGYLVGRYKDKLLKLFTWWGGLIAAFVILFILRLDVGEINISLQQIMSPVLFYPVTFIAIYMAFSFAKLLNRVPYISGFLACAGRNSFHIMALHLLGFKIVDMVYGRIMGIDPSVYSVYPTAFDFWYAYLIFGTLFSIALAELGKRAIAGYKRIHQ